MFTGCCWPPPGCCSPGRLIDYLVEWQSRESRLKMSREDLRDEFKETEGNPQIRGRIRNLQRQSAAAR